MKNALYDFLDYIDKELKASTKREAVLVAFHSDHVISLVNHILMNKLMKEFVKVFRGFSIVEEDVRRLCRIERSPHLSLDDAYYQVYQKEPSEQSSESDSKAKKLRKVVDKIEKKMRMKIFTYKMDSALFANAKDKFFKHLEDLEELMKSITSNLKRKGDLRKGTPMNRLFNTFPNHFHKAKLASLEDKEKKVAWKFCELLVASRLELNQMMELGSRKGWNNCHGRVKVRT